MTNPSKASILTNRRINLVKLGVSLGLEFDETTQIPYLFNSGTVVFDGCNGQRILVKCTWPHKKIHQVLGKGLINMGRRLQKMDIHKALSITSEYED